MSARSLTRLCSLAVAGAALLAFPAGGLAAFDGSLDTSFDGPSGTGNGSFAFDFGLGGNSARGVVVQPDGKIVAVGTAGSDLALARFNVNGSLDISFDGPSGTGNGSFAIEPAGAGTYSGQAVALDSSNRILVAGGLPGTNMDTFVARFDPADGDLDSSFGGGDGVASTSLSTSDDLARDVAVDSAGRIVVAGGTPADATAARFTSGGALDASFDGPGGSANGAFSFDIAGSDVITDVEVQADDKIVLAGRASTGTGGADFSVARLNAADGSFDATFDGPAGQTTTFPGNGRFAYPLTPGTGQDGGQALALQGTKILVGGEAGGSGVMALTRLDGGDGALDASFDGDGIATTDLGSSTDQIEALGIDSKGRIVAVGLSFDPTQEFAALRYDANGALDPFFDSDSGTANGAFRIDVGASTSAARALAFESDGDLVLAGDGFTLARLKVDLTEPNTLMTGPSGPTSDSNPAYTISSTETASSVECTLDAAPVACAIGGGQQFGPLADGPHTLTAAAVDQSGNLDTTPAVRNFTVDTVAPDGSITAGAGLTNDSTPQLSFGSSEAGTSFQCKLDLPAPAPPGSFAACASPLALGPLPDGASTISVRSTDAAGNVDPSDAVATITVDTVTPSATITAGPPAKLKVRKKKKKSARASFSFSSDDPAATLECSLDGAAFAPCSSPFSASLRIGSHDFRVRARDAAGNVSAASGRTVKVKKRKRKKRGKR